MVTSFGPSCFPGVVIAGGTLPKGHPALRAALIFVLGTPLLGPLIGLVTLSVLYYVNSSPAARPAREDWLSAPFTALLWIVFAAPVTVPGSILGAILAILVATLKQASWSRRRWTTVGAVGGAAIAALLTTALCVVLGDNADGVWILAVAVFPGALVGAGGAWVNYFDLESLNKC